MLDSSLGLSLTTSRKFIHLKHGKLENDFEVLQFYHKIVVFFPFLNYLLYKD